LDCATLPMWSSRAYLLAAAIALWVFVPAVAFEQIDSSPADQVRRLTFELDVMPVLTAAGCNQGACHGKSRGQNGFQLSLLGFDPEFDFAAITQAGRGRRVFPAAPDQSLLLAKASARVSHGGGLRLAEESENYHILRQWIAAGMPRNPVDGPTLKQIVVTPAESPLALEETRQLLVAAHYSDGSVRDVTRMCAFQSSEPAVAAIDDKGLIRAGELSGEASIMIRYMGRIVCWNVVIPRGARFPAEQYASLPRNNSIDDHVWRKLAQVGVLPSLPAADSTFLRRAHLDVIGRLPSVEEARAFLADRSPDKRTRLIDRLLANPEYADHWANLWVDLLRPNPYRVGIKATLNFDAWIRDEFRRNVPYDQWVYNLITARGSTWRNGAATLFRDRRTPEEIAPMVAQLFLGARIDCARCHHHPFEVWGQDEFYGMAAYFSQVGYKGSGVSPPISGGEEIVFHKPSGFIKHPLTGQPVEPRPLTGDAPIHQDEDPRDAFAHWLTADGNPYFARAAVNRIWAQLMGRGIVEPVDDMRATNPPTNGPLLDALADEFRRGGYDQKRLLRSILLSYAYGLSSVPNETNAADTQNYSRHYRKRLRAETVLDSMSMICGVPDQFAAMPPGSRAVELWTHRVPSFTLDAFGRPDPNLDPPCERTGETTMSQALHLMNSPELNAKMHDDRGLPARLVAARQQPAEIVETLYLAVYSRPPTPDELTAVLPVFGADPQRWRRSAEDLLWALFNTAEFLFND
ncbi:MAG TPA: DUF1549 and DUF1553 domain-containing protein, partial [Pirellulales bacterium]|nr:DUF1549 and DUF1553 domain-containing protein [Pirellulales bacterium]